MSDSSSPSPLASRLSPVLPVLVIAAVPLAAFLGFSIQPIMGKQLLPIYGGTAGTWLGCMVFFQFALLLGYTWAAWLVQKSIGFQTLATTALGLVAALTFHLPDDDAHATASILRVVWRLSVCSLPAMVLLFSASPLLHGWLRRRGEEVPYYLYAISNAGSLAAVLLYPFVVETHLGLHDQAFFWHGSLAIIVGVLAAAGFILRKNTPAEAAASPTPAPVVSEPLAAGTIGAWLGLSALTCVGMLGATNHLVAEMGSNPLAWVGPFGVFLFSFMVVFSGRWVRWMTVTTIVWLAVSLAGFMVAKGFKGVTVNHTTAWWLLSLTASGSFLGNALLHTLRPAQRFERFYLVLAAGGVLGGLLSSTVIPYVLLQPIEFVLASVALLTAGMVWLNGTRTASGALVTAIVLLAPVLGMGFSQTGSASHGGGRLDHYRDLYGHIMIKTDDRSVVLSSDTTTHGSQLTADLAARRRPTLYFNESSGIGRVIENLQATRPGIRVGVIGLGAGTLAAYARKTDAIDFWDIDPKSIRVARENFTYVAESPGKIDLILRDGRKALEESKADYDLIVVDAFTGDGIPSHLLTREAMTVYFKRLEKRGGLLVVQASNRYSRLFPVVEATARTLGRSSLLVYTEILDSTDTRDWDPTRTEWIVIGDLQTMRTIPAWFPLEEDPKRIKRTLTTVNAPLIQQRLIWTDDRNAAIDAFGLSRFLFEP
jgi:predicted membrane-bound spermidine synthase